MIDVTENTRVEQPAIALFDEPGWQTVNAFGEQSGRGGALRRETTSEVVLRA